MYFYGKCWFITNNFCNSLKVRCFLHFDHTACHLRVLLLLLWSSHPSLSVSLPFSFCLTLHQLCGKIWYILWITFISEWGRNDYWEWGALLCWFTGAVTLLWMFACKKKNAFVHFLWWVYSKRAFYVSPDPNVHVKSSDLLCPSVCLSVICKQEMLMDLIRDFKRL